MFGRKKNSNSTRTFSPNRSGKSLVTKASKNSKQAKQQQNNDVGQYVAPSIKSEAPDAASSVATPPPTSNVETTHATPKQTNLSPTAADEKTQTTSLSNVISEGDEEPSVFSGSTYRTAPTLATAVSQESKDTAFTITRNGKYLTMNGFANGHLMRWKFAAEEGPMLIRIPAILLALGVLATTIYPIVSFPEFWTLPVFICAFHTIATASLVLILEGRAVFFRSPVNFRARVRGLVTRYLNVFRLLWGRGILYIFVGSMNLTIDDSYVLFTGIPMMILGLIAIGSGAHASYNLDRMKTSLTDVSFLWAKFDAQDLNKDNKIDVNEFAELLWKLGLEFDDAYTQKAFMQIDRGVSGLISFEQFRDWWVVTQNGGNAV